MPDDNKTTNTNQPVTEEVPTVGPPSSTATTATPAPDTSGQAIDTPPPPPMQDGAFSPPPPIVEEKKPKETTTTTQEAGATDSTQTIPDIPPVISTSSTKSKKPVGKKMIATILGILVLVGGIGAGVILVQNQQDIREKAAIKTCTFNPSEAGQYPQADCPSGYYCKADISYPSHIGVCTTKTAECIKDTKCLVPGENCCTGKNYFDNKCSVTETRCGIKPSKCIDDGKCLPSGEKCCNDSTYNAACSGTQLKCYTQPSSCISDTKCLVPGENCCTGKNYFDNKCSVTETRCGIKPSKCIDDGNCATSQDECCSKKGYLTLECSNFKCGEEPECVALGVYPKDCVPPGKTCCPGLTEKFVGAEECPVTETQCVDGSPPKPPLPPGIDCSCLTIKAFDEEWNAITNLSSLSAGDVVRFTVSGKTNSGSIDKARFTINGDLRPGVTVKRPSTKEFYDEYTIPESVSTFTINAELRHTALGWF